VNACVAAGGGFMLAVLWLDLMFDVQLRHTDAVDEATRSIATYYRRVTTDAFPMNRLIALVMVATLACIAIQAARHDAARWVSIASALAAVPTIALAATRTVPNAVAVGADATRVDLARMVLRDHVYCFTSISTLVIVQLLWG
jgi:hypothetical protein